MVKKPGFSDESGPLVILNKKPGFWVRDLEARLFRRAGISGYLESKAGLLAPRLRSPAFQMSRNLRSSRPKSRASGCTVKKPGFSDDPGPLVILNKKPGFWVRDLEARLFRRAETSAHLDPKAGLLPLPESKSRLQIKGGEAASAKGR
jgi:hypothetical protein